MIVTERTSLRRPTDSAHYMEFATLLRTRRARIRQFQCCVCAILIAIFTMVLIVTISYSVSQSKGRTNTTTANTTVTLIREESNGIGHNLKLKLSPAFGSYTFSTDTKDLDEPPTILTTTDPLFHKKSNLTEIELREGLLAGQKAIQNRLAADAAALASPLPLQSPESRHRYAVSTSTNVGALALTAIAEIAATKKVESTRSMLRKPSSIGSFFDGGWAPKGTCKHFLWMKNCNSNKYRSFDGSCNQPRQRGAAFIPFRRALPPDYADGIEQPRRAKSGKELPSAREVSLKVHKPSPSTNPSFTVMLAVFGQFLDHDITATAISQGVNGSSISCCSPAIKHPECFPVKVSAGDPFHDVQGRTCIDFVRSAPAPQCKLAPREQLNQVTAFIDGSTIYGADLTVAQDLREFAGGRLKMQRTPDGRTLLPPSTNLNDGCNRAVEELRGRYCFAAGDARANENLHLTTMHLLWARQHNKIVEELVEMNPDWDDETLYQEGRRIIVAQLQHITYKEFLPIILGEQPMKSKDFVPLETGFRKLSDTWDQAVNDPSIANNFASAAFRFAHTLIPGLMRVTDAQEGTSSNVELHKMLFNPYSLYSKGGVERSVTSATQNFIQRTSTHVTSQLTNHLFEDPLANITVPCGLDLVSLNIQRGRDHGLPGYVRWREYCGLGKVKAFSDLESQVDSQILGEISSLYESVEDVDLYTGALAEIPVPGALVGPTFNCLIADQFARLLKGDRYWYEMSDQLYSFTPDQLRELRKSSLAKLICDCADDVKHIQAEVMRSAGPDNPIILCDDMTGPSLEAWKEKSHNSTFEKSDPSIDWSECKKVINDALLDVVKFINDTIGTARNVSEDWLDFKTYVNDSFIKLKNQLAELDFKKIPESSAAINGADNDDSYILRLSLNDPSYKDWTNFKRQLIKSLNDSIANIGGALPTDSEWMAFKSQAKELFADLEKKLESIKIDLQSTLSQEIPIKYEDKEKMANERSITNLTVFDWFNFKRYLLDSLDDAISSMKTNKTLQNEPQKWYNFNEDKITDNKLSENSVNNLVKSKNGTSFVPNTIQSHLEITIVDGTNNKTAFIDKQNSGGFKSKYTENELFGLMKDWMDFCNEMNDSLYRTMDDMKTKKKPSIDAIGWITFKNHLINGFAKLKDQISGIKSEWTINSTSRLQSNQTNFIKFNKSPVQKMSVNSNEHNSSSIIPESEWVDLKKEINNTLTSFLQTINNENQTNWLEVRDIFVLSFNDLKKDIVSLYGFILAGNVPLNKTLINVSNAVKDNWTEFFIELNSTMNNLVRNLETKSKKSISNLMKILSHTRDEIVNLEPPGVILVNKTNYFTDLNKTFTELLERFSGSKRPLLTTEIADPLISSAMNSMSWNTMSISFVISAIIILYAWLNVL